MIEVKSEIGPLKKVLLHRPGGELERLTPKYLEEMLFEDIPWLKKIREEHDLFAETLRNRGCDVFYYQELFTEVLQREETRLELIEEVIESCHLGYEHLKERIRSYLRELDAPQTAGTIIAGLEKHIVDNAAGGPPKLSSYIREAYPFYINPLTNLYFTRDPGAVIGRGVSIHAMKASARSRESVILRYIHHYHPLFAQEGRAGAAPLWYQPEDIDSIEGGDILVLSSRTVIIGCSARTSTEGIERLAERLFTGDSGFKEVIVIQIPFTRAYMHLDTVFTMVDRDAFSIYPEIRGKMGLYRLTPGKGGSLRIESLENLMDTLKRSLQLPAIRLIESGGGDDMTAAREQWNDSTNTLALAPGVVITYDRNLASNDTLRENGIEVVEIEGSELVRGRGGPRCMSMPLLREPIA